MKKTLAMYEEGNYEVIETVGKDWNQFLKQEKLNGLCTEKIPLRAKEQIRNCLAKDTHPHFTYSFQDAQSKGKINEFLIDSFGIHPSIVSTLVKKGFIRQDTNDRIVYLWNDSGIVVGGQLRGTFLDKKVFGRKGYEEAIMDRSRKGYGFNVTLGKPNSIHFFQTPEDLLGYWSLTIDQLNNTLLFSLSDTKIETVIDLINKQLDNGFGIKKVQFCIENNPKGLALIDQVAQLEAFDSSTRSLRTKNENRIELQTVRPRLGIDWLAELGKKKERQRVVKRIQQTQENEKEQVSRQQLHYTRKHELTP